MAHELEPWQARPRIVASLPTKECSTTEPRSDERLSLQTVAPLGTDCTTVMATRASYTYIQFYIHPYKRASIYAHYREAGATAELLSTHPPTSRARPGVGRARCRVDVVPSTPHHLRWSRSAVTRHALRVTRTGCVPERARTDRRMGGPQEALRSSKRAV